MKSPADSHEITVLESKGILIHDQIFHAVLTDRRIILTRYVDNKLSIRSIYFPDIQKIEEDMDYSGDPVIILVTSYAKGKVKKVVLHFPQKNFPDHFKERSLWASEINKMLRSVSWVSPAPVLKKPPVTQAFCVKCGKKCTDSSAFCAKCGTKIIYPVQPLPSQEIGTSVRKGMKITEIPIEKIELPQKNDISTRKNVEITEIPVEKIELPQKESSIPYTNDSDVKENIPFNPPPHKEHEKKKSFFMGSGSRKPAVIAVFVLVCVIIVIVAFFVLFPPGSTGFNFMFPLINATVPSSDGTPSATSHQVTTPTISKTTRAPQTPVQTRTLVRNNTSVRTPAIPVQTMKQ